tara:strand:- start:2423 stop:3757 length:1335 start_codon:yes stop_codon:yes gene_type:complete
MPMLDFPGAKLQKLGPSGEKIVANAVPGLDAFGGEGPKIKNVVSTATSTIGNELLSFAQSLQGHGEDLKYPLETGNPAYQSRVKFQVFEFRSKQDGVTQKSHVKQPTDNLSTNTGLVDGTEHAEEFANLGPSTTASQSLKKPLSPDEEDEALEIAERGISAQTEKALAGAAAQEDSITDTAIGKAAIAAVSGGLDFQLKRDEPIVDLYMPISFNYADGVQYENASLGASGAVTEALVNAGADVAVGAGKAVADLYENAKGSFFDLLDGNVDIASEASRFSLQRINEIFNPLSGIKNAVTGATRMIINPNVRALFRGVNLREFAFQFKFIADSAQEAEQVRKIIKHFRKQLYPDTFGASFNVGGTTVNADVGYKFPHVFQISFHHRGSRNLKLPKFKYCYLRNVNHTINPTGGALRRDGQPNEIDLTLSFVEYKALTKQDIEQGF